MRCHTLLSHAVGADPAGHGVPQNVPLKAAARRPVQQPPGQKVGSIARQTVHRKKRRSGVDLPDLPGDDLQFRLGDHVDLGEHHKVRLGEHWAKLSRRPAAGGAVQHTSGRHVLRGRGTAVAKSGSLDDQGVPLQSVRPVPELRQVGDKKMIRADVPAQTRHTG